MEAGQELVSRIRTNDMGGGQCGNISLAIMHQANMACIGLGWAGCCHMCPSGVCS
jgi:hypothetical protein